MSSLSPLFILILIEALKEGIYSFSYEFLYNKKEQQEEDTKIAFLYEEYVAVESLY